MSMIEYYVRNSGTPWESQHWQLRTAIQFRQQRQENGKLLPPLFVVADS